jgi:hypothetical protein
MKVKLKKMLGLAALGMTLFANTVPTWAGYKSTPEVSIRNYSQSLREGKGSMVGARYSADSTQYIGCYINAAPFVVCSASDSAGNYAGCISYDARHIDAVQRMTDSSHIIFDFNPSNAACSTIRIYDDSYYLK